MVDSNIRVRFAPSPTGYLHVGGARTALFNWLFARRAGGKFLLRVEDTDRARSSDEHTQVILDGLGWFGLDWDEDVVFQGAGLARHQQLADQLLDTDHVYLDDGAIRFRMPQEAIAWDDLVHERIEFHGRDIKDWIILRSDRTPTYNFSVVADDLDMRVTHVIRGDDHISNTPKQIAVYRALGADLPVFGHVPMIHGTDGKKLSKRHGATAVGDYRHEGILPSAMRNFLALLGWSPGNDRELFFTTKELLEGFSVEGLQRKSAVFDPKKLEWMNGQHLSNTPAEDIIALIRPELEERYNLGTAADDVVRKAVEVVRTRARTTHEVAQRVAVRLDAAFITRDAKAEKLLTKDADGFRAALDAVHTRLAGIDNPRWHEQALETELRSVADDLEVGAGKVMQPIRVALTGGTVSEPVNELLCLVGKEESLRRIKAAQAWEPVTE